MPHSDSLKAASFGFMAVSLVTTTVPTEQDAHQMAQAAVKAKLAACVQVERITSHYLWEGEVQANEEWRLVMKTVPDGVQPLVEWLRSCHPYEVPQILMRGEQAQRDFGKWVAQCVQVPLRA